MKIAARNGFVAGAIAVWLAIICTMPGAWAQTPPTSPEQALRWINGYRHKPQPKAVPSLIRGLSGVGAFSNPENSGVYVGFLAGVIAREGKAARTFVKRLPKLPFHDQWLVIKAVAYSGHPEWKIMLRDLAVRIPERHAMVEMYLTGKLPTLDRIPLRAKAPPSWAFWRDKPKGRQITFVDDPDLLDTLWGVYFASGREAPLMKLVSMLPWSEDGDNIDRLSAGSMVKYTLATNASRDVKLLAQLKRAAPRQKAAVRKPLSQVIAAAETSDTGHIRKQALAAVEELRQRGPASKRAIASWGGLGETAVALGCLTAAATGQVQFGLPCVIGGALGSAALRHLSKPN